MAAREATGMTGVQTRHLSSLVINALLSGSLKENRSPIIHRELLQPGLTELLIRCSDTKEWGGVGRRIQNQQKWSTEHLGENLSLSPYKHLHNPLQPVGLGGPFCRPLITA